jgi:gliding motility-associated-like protein
VYNNFISDIAAVGKPMAGNSNNAYGIVAMGPGPYEINYNTVVMTPNSIRGSSDRSAAMFIASSATNGSITSMRNNIFVNQQASNGPNSKPLALDNASPGGVFTFASIDHNDYYSVSNLLASDGTTDATDLTQLQALLGGNANSKNILPNFVSPTDLHLATTGNVGIENAGTPVISIYTDIDKETRNAVTPDIGADELVCNAPGIITPPVAQTVANNDNASFSVTATGTGPLAYQWEVNDGSGFTPITDNATYSNSATATLNITNASLNMNGYRYRCVVRGRCMPPTTSADALLTVGMLPQQLNFQTQTSGSTITVTYGDGAVNAAANASSGLPVTYNSSNTSVGTVGPAGQITILGAGTTVITVSQSGDARYSAAADITLTIVVNKKDLRVTADDKTRPQDTPNPALTITYNGFVNGEDASVINVPNITTTATVNSGIGSYPISLTGGSAANYRLILIDGSLIVTAPVLTIVQEPVNAEVCERTSAIFSLMANNMPNITYQWQENANGSDWRNINGATNNTYVAPGTYTRMLRCAVSTPGTTLYTRTVQLTIHPTPDVQATAGYSDCTGTRVQLNATGALTYEWSPMQDLNGAYTDNPIASPTVNTLYTVVGRDAFGCRATAQVQVDIRKNNFKMANAFTPNGDGNNDCFGIRSWGMLQKVDFNIYNRYGMLVFHTASAAACWDGKLKGNDLSSGTYVYSIVAVTECGVIKRRGTVTLVR